jgi:Bacterial transcriptional regulator
LLAAKSDDEAIALLRKMDRKAFTKATRTSLSSLMEQIRSVRETGFATVEELEVGLLSIAVPIMNRRGDTVASLNVSSSATRTKLVEFCSIALPVMRNAEGNRNDPAMTKVAWTMNRRDATTDTDIRFGFNENHRAWGSNTPGPARPTRLPTASRI